MRVITKSTIYSALTYVQSVYHAECWGSKAPNNNDIFIVLVVTIFIVGASGADENGTLQGVK